MHKFVPLVLVSAAIGSPMAASAHRERAVADSPFKLEAYGDGVDRLALFSSGVTATDDGTWLGSPDASAFADSRSLPAWAELALSIPKDVASTHAVVLVDPASSAADSLVTSGFDVYGDFVIATVGGVTQDLWYAVSTDTDGVYALKWDSSSDATAGQIIITLRAASTS